MIFLLCITIKINIFRFLLVLRIFPIMKNMRKILQTNWAGSSLTHTYTTGHTQRGIMMRKISFPFRFFTPHNTFWSSTKFVAFYPPFSFCLYFPQSNIEFACVLCERLYWLLYAFQMFICKKWTRFLSTPLMLTSRFLSSNL